MAWWPPGCEGRNGALRELRLNRYCLLCRASKSWDLLSSVVSVVHRVCGIGHFTIP